MGMVISNKAITKLDIMSYMAIIIVALLGAWWYESEQLKWDWLSYVFTTVFIIGSVTLINYIISRFNSNE